MKKAKLLSIVLALLATVLFVVGLAFVKWKDSNPNATPSDFKFYIIVFILVGLLATILFKAGCKAKYAVLVPAIALIEVGSLYYKDMVALTASDRSTITDIFLVNEKTIIAFLLFAAYVVLTVLAIAKKYKWAAIFGLAYNAIYLITVLYYLPTIAFEKTLKLYTFTSLGLIFAYAAFIAYFAKFLFTCDCGCSCEAKAQEAPQEASKAEEAPVKGSEASENITAEEKVEE